MEINITLTIADVNNIEKHLNNIDIKDLKNVLIKIITQADSILSKPYTISDTQIKALQSLFNIFDRFF